MSKEPSPSTNSQSDAELVAAADAFADEIEAEDRFNASESARQKQDSPFADEVIEAPRSKDDKNGSTDPAKSTETGKD